MAPPVLSVAWTDTIVFSLNGRRVTLPRPHPNLKLVSYLRDVEQLTGTKLSCGEGGCGACTVVLCHRPLDHLPFGDTANASVVFRAVNACLFPVCALDGIEVFTVEGVGSSVAGLHAVQERLVKASGTQCGFCTPGMVMNMYELVRKTTTRSARDIEDHFDGNLCRCTGYRPILEAFHSFATTATSAVAIEYEDGSGDQSDTQHPLAECEFLDDWLLVESVETGKKTICEAKCGGSSTPSCSTYLELEDLFPPRPRLEETAPHDPAHDIEPSDFVVNFKPRPLKFEAVDPDGKTTRKWYRPLTLAHLQSVFDENCVSDIAFVGGRTAHGVSKYYNSTAPYNRSTEHLVQVELNYIAEMKAIEIDVSQHHVRIGAAVTLATLLKFLQQFERDEYDPSTFRAFAALVQRIASNQVRNAGTWAGNLSLCREHPSFDSDLVVGLLGIGATLTLLNEKLERRDGVAIDTFLQMRSSDFTVVLAMDLPLSLIGSHHHLRCDKVAQRPQLAHAHVNSAIWLATRADQSPIVCLDTRIAFGGVCRRTARFPSTEAFFKSRELTPQTLRDALTHLEQDVSTIGASDAFGSAPFRLAVMKNMLYKAILSIIPPDQRDSAVVSAPDRLARGVSSGTQTFKPSDATMPVSQPIPKLGSKLQASGEATYTVDMPLPPHALFGAIVFSRVALGTLLSIDKTNAVKSMPGVVDLLTAADIRGANDVSSGTKEEPLFVPVGGVVRSVGVPLALVVATTADVAEAAVAACHVEYGAVPPDQLWHGQAVDTPITHIEAAIAAGTLAQPDPIVMGDDDVETKLRACPHVLTGSLLLGAQKHFYMEPQVSVVSLGEGGVFHVTSSSQFPTFLQQQLAAVLGVRYHDIVVNVPRVGGGFGAKLTRCVINAAAAAVAAQKHRRVVRVLNDRSADFRLVGGREPMRGTYTIGYDDTGRIQAVDLRLNVDCGFIIGDSIGDATMAVQWADAAYHVPSFRCRAFLYFTNTQNCTSHRAPGVPQSRVLYEAALHHVAETLGVPMRWVQERHLYQENDKTPYGQTLTDVRLREVWDRLLASADVTAREDAIAVFNANHKWKKRGIAVTPTKYAMQLSGRRDGARVEIFAGDGSVVVVHGGCEIGQGIHTKAAQVCAYALGIPLQLVSVRSTSTDQTPNSEATGGSSTSESVARSVLACCTELQSRLKQLRDANTRDSWAELVARAHAAGVCLFAGAQPFSTLPSPTDTFDYFVYAAACADVEVDILTGELNIRRVEIVYDCGISLNPAIDIGQIEGAFVMGIGLYLQEEVAYDANDGALLTQGTWEYKVPCSHDIPERLSVTLLENDRNVHGVLNSKATGEPPYALATSVYFAAKRALLESRHERGNDAFFHLDVPATVARRQVAAEIHAADYAW